MRTDGAGGISGVWGGLEATPHVVEMNDGAFAFVCVSVCFCASLDARHKLLNGKGRFVIVVLVLVVVSVCVVTWFPELSICMGDVPPSRGRVYRGRDGAGIREQQEQQGGRSHAPGLHKTYHLHSRTGLPIDPLVSWHSRHWFVSSSQSSRLFDSDPIVIRQSVEQDRSPHPCWPTT